MRLAVVWLGALVLLPWLSGCPSETSDDEGATGSSTPSTQSSLDAPMPAACEDLGGTCNCVGSCNAGEIPTAEGTCPQPPAEAGACSQECCVPASATGTGTTAAATADATADTAAPVCDCAVLPLCATPEGEDCGGQYPEGHCCDDTATPMTCTCPEPCDGGFPCCTLQPGCA